MRDEQELRVFLKIKKSATKNYPFPDVIFDYKSIVYEISHKYISTLESFSNNSLVDFYHPYNKSRSLNLFQKEFYFEGLVNFDDLLLVSLLNSFVYFDFDGREKVDFFISSNRFYKIIFNYIASQNDTSSKYLSDEIKFFRGENLFKELLPQNKSVENYVLNFIKFSLFLLKEYDNFFENDEAFLFFIQKLTNTLELLKGVNSGSYVDFSLGSLTGPPHENPTLIYYLLYLLSELYYIKLFGDSRISADNYTDTVFARFVEVKKFFAERIGILENDEIIEFVSLPIEIEKIDFIYVIFLLLYFVLLEKNNVIKIKDDLLLHLYVLARRAVKRIENNLYKINFLNHAFNPNINSVNLGDSNSNLLLEKLSKLFFVNSLLWVFSTNETFSFSDLQSVQTLETFENQFNRLIYDYFYNEQSYIFAERSNTSEEQAFFNMLVIPLKLYLLSKLINNKARQNIFNIKLIVQVIE